MVDRMASLFGGEARRHEPVGLVKVVDPNALNWPDITYNTVEELVRVDHDGNVEPAAMKNYRWADDRTLEVGVRGGEVFLDGGPLNRPSNSPARAWARNTGRAGDVQNVGTRGRGGVGRVVRG